MKQFKCKSSKEVKLVTTATIIAMLLLIISIFLNNGLKTYLGISISVVVVFSLIYFYARSSNQVILEEDKLILERNIGSIVIPLKDIQNIQQLRFSNIPMTVGSMGFFGYIGTTMDNSVALVNDRTEMFRIFTKNRSYTVSCEDAADLIEEIRKVIK